VVDVDAFGRDAEPGERFTLGGEVLLVGGDPRIADEELAHERSSVPYRPPSPGIFSGGSYGTRAGLANATLQLRVTVVRLFNDFVVEERVRDRNPVGRGYRTADGRGGRRGLVPRFEPLPWIPTDAQWRAVLAVGDDRGGRHPRHVTSSGKSSCTCSCERLR
jgi:integrase/recombinase XerD